MNRIFRPGWVALFGVALLLLAVAPVGAADPATQPAARPAAASVGGGSITGTVKAEGEIPMSEMVVYLESPEAGRVVPTPKESVKVSQKGAQFAPPVVIASVGQSVDFLNDEGRPIEHNVFSNSPAKRFDLGLYPPGQSRAVVFDKPGPVFLYCSIHRHMDGVIFVSPTPYTSRVNADGKYAIENVPPGIWVVKTWQRRRRFAEQNVPVLVEAGKSAASDLELRRK